MPLRQATRNDTIFIVCRMKITLFDYQRFGNNFTLPNLSFVTKVCKFVILVLAFTVPKTTFILFADIKGSVIIEHFRNQILNIFGSDIVKLVCV